MVQNYVIVLGSIMLEFTWRYYEKPQKKIGQYGQVSQLRTGPDMHYYKSQVVTT